MNIVSFRQQTTKLYFGFILLCLLALNAGQVPVVRADTVSSNVRSSWESDTCVPSTGWVWTTGSLQPEIAQQTELALMREGIEATVIATSFGEKDSCGNFELFSTDFSLTLKSNPLASSSETQELADRILAVLSQSATPQLGNVQINFGSGETKFYSNPTEVSSASAMSTSSPEVNAALNKKVYLIVYDPILSNGQRFSAYMGWTGYATLVQGIIDRFNTASHGQLQYVVVDTYVTSSTSEWPIKIDGFRYTEEEYISAYQNQALHLPNDVDYDAIVGNPQFDICGKLNRGEIDELWLYGGPYDGFYESRLVGPNGYGFNSPPMTETHNCNKLLPIMGLNFERGLPEALHSFGHRAEATMTRVYGSWQENRTAHNWDRFALVKALSPNFSYSGCGNIHYPPNGVTDYDYANSGTILTNCEDFNNYPELSDPLTVAQSVTCTTWSCTGDPHLAYMMYWYSHLPSNAGCGADGVANNWWLYFADPNLALTPSLRCLTGNAGIGGVALSYTDGTSKTIVSASNGNYSITVPNGWSGTVTPSKTGYTFSPISRTYTNVLANQTAQNYTVLVAISGNAGIAGAALSYVEAGAPKSVLADGSGKYTVNIPPGWTGTVTPKKIGYQFTPVNRAYSNVQSNQTAQNYTAAVCPTCADKDTVGVFRPSNGALYLRNLNVTGFADVAINYGLAGDYPVVGDWDSNGTDTIGVYRNGVFYLRNFNTLGIANITVAFGSPGDQPIAGDWNNDGTDTIGVYRSSTGTFLLRNTNTPGTPDLTFSLGNVGDVGIAGDWNGDGTDTTGIFRPSNGMIFLKNTNASGFADIALNYGLPGDQPVVGDWDNNGTTTIGIYRNARFYLRNSNTNGFANIQLDLGNVGDRPIAGNWDAKP